ncbi:MAG: hypothetical protein RL637_66 [Pseudomonadota bacterium]|jgi:molybdopterin synthase catalytic subunit
MIQIIDQALDPWAEIQHYQHSQPQMDGQFGATAIFVGTMRDFNQGDNVSSLFLEYYPLMTEKQLAMIETQARQQWSVLDILMIHRVGEILPNQPIVLVAVWSIHRHDSLEACRFLIDSLKTQAPFWKQERLPSNQYRWVNP